MSRGTNRGGAAHALPYASPSAQAEARIRMKETFRLSREVSPWTKDVLRMAGIDTGKSSEEESQEEYPPRRHSNGIYRKREYEALRAMYEKENRKP